MGNLLAARNELQDLIDKRRKTYVSAINIASGYAVLKETDEVFKWLETAYVERDSNLTWLNVDREFDYLRDDTRFRSILQRVNLPDADRARITGIAIEEEKPDADAPQRSLLAKLILACAAMIILGLIAYYFVIPFFLA